MVMKLYVKDKEIQPVTSWTFETITDALAEAHEKLAHEKFRHHRWLAEAKECERLYKIKEQMEYDLIHRLNDL